MSDDTGPAEDTSQSVDDLVVLPASASEEDVEFGIPYYARVNNTVEYGVFVTLAGTSSDDVTGLVHETNISGGFASDDFVIGDTLAVQLREWTEKGPSFELVEVLEGAKVANGTRVTSVHNYSPVPKEDEDESAPERASSGPIRPESPAQGFKAITARLDAIETTLALDRPTVRARVVDAGDDVTLLRVLDSDGMVEMDHGEVVTVALHDADGRETGGDTDGQGGE